MRASPVSCLEPQMLNDLPMDAGTRWLGFCYRVHADSGKHLTHASFPGGID